MLLSLCHHSLRRPRVVAATAAAGIGAMVGVSTRQLSSARTSFSGEKYSPSWGAKQGSSSVSSSSSSSSREQAYPDPHARFPHRRPKFRKTHIEWLLHHGHGERLGKFGPTRELADFEYDDGTPASISPRRFAFKHHQDHLLVQLIRAGATVERYEAEQRLPRIPGTKEQRDWDPEIPLFLDDLDERGQAPVATATGFSETSAIRDAASATAALVEERFSSTKQKTTPINTTRLPPADDPPLEVNTMFASYDPKSFVSDEIPKADRQRPYWSRRRWSLSDNFMVPVSPKPKNTIKDE